MTEIVANKSIYNVELFERLKWKIKYGSFIEYRLNDSTNFLVFSNFSPVKWKINKNVDVSKNPFFFQSSVC